jgi:hypothetical protein
MLKPQWWKIWNTHMYPKHRYGMKVKLNDWSDYEMHMLKIRCKCECITMDQYGESNWVPLCFFAWTFCMRNRKQCWSLDHKQKYPNSLQILFYFALSSPNQEDYIAIDAKCLMFLWFFQETLVCVSRVFETQY